MHLQWRNYLRGTRRKNKKRQTEKRWLDDLEDGLHELSVRRWRVRAKRRDEWRQMCLKASN